MNASNNIQYNQDHLAIIIMLIILAIATTWRIKSDIDEKKIKEIKTECVKTYIG